jgi:hypothetical protein
VGTVFDRGELATPVRGKDVSGRAGTANNRGQKAPPELDGDQYKLLLEEAQFGLAEPTNRFKRENSDDTSIGDIQQDAALSTIRQISIRGIGFPPSEVSFSSEGRGRCRKKRTLQRNCQ